METYEPKELFDDSLKNDASLLFNVTEDTRIIGNLLGMNNQLLKGVYAAFRESKESFEHKPMVGATLLVTFDYTQGTVFFDRQTSQLELTIPQFLQFLGKIDLAYSPIYSVGTIVELNEQLLLPELRELFQQEEGGALVVLSGRKIPLIAPFDQYVVDYLGHLWPYGEIPGTDPILISTMMIKRVVSESLMNDVEKTFQFEGLRKVQATNQQLSTAFMTADETEAFIETLSEIK